MKVAMIRQADEVYEFDEFRLEPAERVLLRNGEPVPLTPKSFETLLILVRNNNHLVEKTKLLAEIWPDTFVEEKTLAQNVFILRKTLGTDAAGRQYIQTVPRYGYRFVADVRVAQRERPPVIAAIKLAGTRPAEDESVGAAEEGGPVVNGTNEELTAPESCSDQASAFQERSPAAGTTGNLSGLIKRCRPVAVVIILAALIFGASAFFALKYSADDARPIASPPADHFQTMKVTNLTTLGKSQHAAISPDGKYVAHVMTDAGRQSLWLKHVVTAGHLQLVPPAEVTYVGLTFSPDGNFIFYVLYEKNQNVGVLRRVPVLGGNPTQLITDIDSPVACSPDGRHLAFIRNHPNSGVYMDALVVADADGSREREVASLKGQIVFAFVGPAWSPDGRTIACVTVNYDQSRRMNVVEVSASGGAERPVTDWRWANISALTWLPDMSGLLIVAAEPDSPSGAQVWLLSYPGGEARRITNDLNYYQGVSVTADARALVTTQSDQMLSIWVSKDGDPRHGEELEFAVGGVFGSLLGLSWSPGGKIVYASNESGNSDIWVVTRDGKNKQQLTVDGHADHSPVVSPDGKQIVFISNRSGLAQVWRMEADGSNQTQLTGGDFKDRPRWSPDGEWIVYTSQGAWSGLWKMPAGGGEPIRLTDRRARFPAISSDGRLISFELFDDKTSRRVIAVMPFDGRAPAKTLEMTTTTRLWASQWTPDGKALRFVDSNGDTSNIWQQPLDGGPRQRLTDFQSIILTDFAWSPDGRQVVYARGVTVSDVVLISDFR
ncbi:MAG TPA: winged helix-turn-helix domain-containing protein [Pyrinomonadaceae bacterium]|jgi:Tol biopolymer transport system component/DNA-binding winged helix-turn-helix (wHTH) protein